MPSLDAFFAALGSLPAAVALLTALRWPDRVTCPHCGSGHVGGHGRYARCPDLRHYHCKSKACRRTFLSTLIPLASRTSRLEPTTLPTGLPAGSRAITGLMVPVGGSAAVRCAGSTRPATNDAIIPRAKSVYEPVQPRKWSNTLRMTPANTESFNSATPLAIAPALKTRPPPGRSQ
jgi:hypothetical protein